MSVSTVEESIPPIIGTAMRCMSGDREKYRRQLALDRLARYYAFRDEARGEARAFSW